MSAPVDKIILMLVSGVAADAIVASAARMNLTTEQAKEAVAAARKAITVAADYDRDEQIGLAFTRLNDLYGKAADIDPKVALAAQKELNKLLSLYSGPQATAPISGESSDELERVAAHLLPLKLAPDTYPISEHARLAAAKAREK